MGLDSVHLLMKIEDYFQISFKDKDAEKIYTVEDLSIVISEKKGIIETEKRLLDNFTFKILKIINESNNGLFDKTTAISKIESTYSDDFYKSISLRLNLKIPRPYKNDNSKIIKIFRKILHSTSYNWKEITLENFAEAILIKNFEKFTDKNQINSTYEVYIICAGIIAKKMDVDCYEIKPWKRITTDLGID
ncbi:hypothetical protein [Chryseobacterium sp.]|uniref:hypothetical protein n=1 Tax=Chryseobacterium sp. TaxID=1871047 RepID=UPI002898E379|nr:hypothetical protein [Chryseobacterium sp.]